MLDISNIIRLHPQLLRQTRFILDVHLGKLAKYLRLLGFDVAYENNFSDETIMERGKNEHRIVLTRDIGLLKNKKITHGDWMRNINLVKQVDEVLQYLDLYKQCKPFTPCIECNGLLEIANKSDVRENIPPLAYQYYQHFMRCQICKRIYWEGYRIIRS